ncbi:hypothetical protein BGZ63DRAFT_75794 [Mariannaea sp. PMI_226]|nr:hypothetical protein BGZ63DRAFT_75794 [Mariannaea sp. PMI_226]
MTSAICQVDPTGIYNFIDTYRDGNGDRQQPSCYQSTADYYPSRIMSEDSSASHHNLTIPRSMMSGDTSHTAYSEVFDPEYAYRSPTILTVPSTDGDVRDFHHLPLPNPEPTAPTLPCEFNHYDRCNASFHIDDEEGWLTHIANVHLNHVFPTHCICWFCSAKYVATSNTYNDRKACYQKRIHHIARHLRRREYGLDEIRPDYHFIDHIYRIRIIGNQEYDYLREYREEDSQQGHNFYPAGWRRPEAEQPVMVEVARSSQSKKKRHTQRSHR